MVVDGTVYVGSDNDQMYGLAPADGSVRWSWTAPAGAFGTVVGDTAYVGADDGLFRAVALGDKSERWHLRVLSGLVSSPSIDDDIVYVGSPPEGADPNGELYALDRSTRKLRWSFRAPSGLQVGPSIVRDGVITPPRSRMACSRSPRRMARSSGTSTRRGVFVPAAMAGDVIYVTGDRGVAAFRATDGRKLWETETGFATRPARWFPEACSSSAMPPAACVPSPSRA